MEELNQTTAIITIHPESDLVVLQLLCEANKLRDYAESRVIKNDDDLKLATDDLAIIAKVKKSMADKKAEYYKPVKAHLDAITASFQILLTPVEDADRITRMKWTTYRTDQVRRQAEADEINRQKEELARREAAFNGTGEITVDLTPAVAPVPVAKVRTDLGSAQTTKTWRGEVIDFKLLPEEFKMPDYVKLGRVIRAGLHIIPGVKIIEEENIRVTTK